MSVKSRKNPIFHDRNALDEEMYRRSVFYWKILIFPKPRAGKNTRKMPLLRNRGAERRVYENRAYEAGKDHRYLV